MNNVMAVLILTVGMIALVSLLVYVFYPVMVPSGTDLSLAAKKLEKAVLTALSGGATDAGTITLDNAVATVESVSFNVTLYLNTSLLFIENPQAYTATYAGKIMALTAGEGVSINKLVNISKVIDASAPAPHIDCSSDYIVVEPAIYYNITPINETYLRIDIGLSSVDKAALVTTTQEVKELGSEVKTISGNYDIIINMTKTVLPVYRYHWLGAETELVLYIGSSIGDTELSLGQVSENATLEIHVTRYSYTLTLVPSG